MFTQTHLLVGAVLFARSGAPALAIAGLSGALLPDTDVWLMFVTERARGTPGCEIFHYRYLQEPWTSVQAVMNSIPLYATILMVGAIALKASWPKARQFGSFAAAFAVSALLHVGSDFLLHHDDARMQLQPFTDWVFRSPISYWNPDHYGRYFALFEFGLAICLVVILARRFRKTAVRIALILALPLYSGSVVASFFDLASHDKGPGSCERLAVERSLQDSE